MHRPAPFILALLAGLAACQSEQPATTTAPGTTRTGQPAAASQPPKTASTPWVSIGFKNEHPYPPAVHSDTSDDYHGTKVADPYRGLEEYTDATNAWIEAENKVTFAYLASIPERAQIKDRVTKLWNFERYTAPSKEGGHYFFGKNNGLQNQNVLYTVDKLSDEPRVLLDPNTLRADGTVALAGTSVSEDGKYLAYGTSEAGSDWNVWKVRDIATTKDLADEVRWVKFGGASWTKDGKGFFYSRFDEPKPGEDLKAANKFQKIYYHTLGKPQSEDTLAYDRKDQPEWYLVGGVTDDGHYLIIGVEPGAKIENGLFYKDLTKPDAPVVELLNTFDSKYDFIDNDGTTFWVKSDLDAPRGRVWAIDTNHPERANWKEVIPQTGDALQGVSSVGNKLIASYLHDAQTRVRVYDTKGKWEKDIELPGIGTAGGFGGKRKDTETFYSFTGYTVPGAIYRYDIPTGKSELYKKPRVDFNPDSYTTEQVFFKSKDGTRIPMFITQKKGTKHDGTAPTLLYAYGGFNISLTPGFSVGNAVWLEMGGIYCVANLRGGGEYGEDWHKGGMKLVKQNVFDDFIGAAEWLIKNKYTSTPHLAIQGGSNGGLLVGACMTQRPELYGACLPQVGVMDMLRFQKFTVGWGWVGDYGSSDKGDEFKALYAYSPYHNLKKGTCYPPTMVTTADHDDRVYPAHSFKYAAALQAAQGCDNPTLIRIETRAGHGAGKPTGKRIEEIADMWAFLVKSLKMNVQGVVASPGHG